MQQHLWSKNESFSLPGESSLKKISEKFRVNLRIQSRNKRFEKSRLSLGLVNPSDNSASNIGRWQSVFTALNIAYNSNAYISKFNDKSSFFLQDPLDNPIDLLREKVVRELNQLSSDVKLIVSGSSMLKDQDLSTQNRLQDKLINFVQIISVLIQVNEIDSQLFVRQTSASVFETAQLMLEHINLSSFELVN